MAVYDEEQRPSTRDRAAEGLRSKDILAYLSGIFLAAGVLMYAYLSICYGQFYGSLGINPSDVGLSYAGTLARSSGFALTAGVIPLALLTGAYLGERGAPPYLLPGHRRPSFISVLGRYILLGLILYVPLTIPLIRAGEAATEVKAGKAVGPIQTPTPKFPPLWQLPILAIHADPTTVEPAGKPEDSPAAERLRGRRLLFLGQADGTVVFYDATEHRAVYVPASAVILHVANCWERPPLDPAC
jgi:hypothetical protein